MTESKMRATTCAGSAKKAVFDLLREKNFKALENARFQLAPTTDPHTFNALRNEYHANGAATPGNGPPSPLAGKPVIQSE